MGNLVLNKCFTSYYLCAILREVAEVDQVETYPGNTNSYHKCIQPEFPVYFVGSLHTSEV